MDGLADLMHAYTEDDEREVVTDIAIGPKKEIVMAISLAPDDGQAPGSLFAYHVWNGATCLAEFFAEDPVRVAGKKIVEFGAASALPSLVALHLGASVAVMTDYPAPVLIENMQKNVTRNADKLDNGNAVVLGHLWGEDTAPLRAYSHEDSGETGFDVAIVAECLWLHKEHDNLLASIMSCLKPGGQVFICFSHHVPGMETADLSFFKKATATYQCTVERLQTYQVQAVFNSAKTKDQFLYCITKQP
ncbi:nicotinamide n-methyltransferase [Achlya hypogyna]|uniref:Nicotinamide n-methyltransferase n=1 Tax=Achlya hypogyna TaxID=1202772 RepID=A0A1V9YAP0_ACHHY|nr:nicotinamide n-methyltransferase [Achlya hypogyna]